MNRRAFIRSSAFGLFPLVLPSALTYQRKWAPKVLRLDPDALVLVGGDGWQESFFETFEEQRENTIGPRMRIMRFKHVPKWFVGRGPITKDALWKRAKITPLSDANMIVSDEEMKSICSGTLKIEVRGEKATKLKLLEAAPMLGPHREWEPWDDEMNMLERWPEFAPLVEGENHTLDWSGWRRDK